MLILLEKMLSWFIYKLCQPYLFCVYFLNNLSRVYQLSSNIFILC